MKKLRYIVIILIFLPICVRSQIVKNYISGSVDFGSYYPNNSRQNGYIEMGIGLEYGIAYNNFYIGAECGFYGIVIYKPTTSYELISIANDGFPTKEEYLGIHGGVILDSWLWLGIVLLVSTTEVDHFSYDAANQVWNESIKHPLYFNIGPDLRFKTSTHFSVNTAFTIRRGLKLGASYLF